MSKRHVTVAMIVAPILAVISYFATDYLVSEPPQMAEGGESYELLPRSNCRYESGRCTLRNGDVELNLLLLDGRYLEVSSSLPLDGVRLAYVSDGKQSDPMSMVSKKDNGMLWQVTFVPSKPAEGLRLALKVDDKLFYASAPTTFFEYQTGMHVSHL